MSLAVRNATLADATAVRDVHLASIEGLAGQRYDDDQVDAWAHDRDPDDYPIESDETHFLVAERDGDVVGFGWLKPEADDYFESSVKGEVTAVYVDPSVARDGVGTDIYEELEARAIADGVELLGLWASLNAVAFYETMGFDRVTTHGHEFQDGVSGTVVEMRKVLE